MNPQYDGLTPQQMHELDNFMSSDWYPYFLSDNIKSCVSRLAQINMRYLERLGKYHTQIGKPIKPVNGIVANEQYRQFLRGDLPRFEKTSLDVLLNVWKRAEEALGENRRILLHRLENYFVNVQERGPPHATSSPSFSTLSREDRNLCITFLGGDWNYDTNKMTVGALDEVEKLSKHNPAIKTMLDKYYTETHKRGISAMGDYLRAMTTTNELGVLVSMEGIEAAQEIRNVHNAVRDNNNRTRDNDDNSAVRLTPEEQETNIPVVPREEVRRDTVIFNGPMNVGHSYAPDIPTVPPIQRPAVRARPDDDGQRITFIGHEGEPMADHVQKLAYSFLTTPTTNWDTLSLPVRIEASRIVNNFPRYRDSLLRELMNDAMPTSRRSHIRLVLDEARKTSAVNENVFGDEERGALEFIFNRASQPSVITMRIQQSIIDRLIDPDMYWRRWRDSAMRSAETTERRINVQKIIDELNRIETRVAFVQPGVSIAVGDGDDTSDGRLATAFINGTSVTLPRGAHQLVLKRLSSNRVLLEEFRERVEGVQCHMPTIDGENKWRSLAYYMMKEVDEARTKNKCVFETWDDSDMSDERLQHVAMRFVQGERKAVLTMRAAVMALRTLLNHKPTYKTFCALYHACDDKQCEWHRQSVDMLDTYIRLIDKEKDGGYIAARFIRGRIVVLKKEERDIVIRKLSQSTLAFAFFNEILKRRIGQRIVEEWNTTAYIIANDVKRMLEGKRAISGDGKRDALCAIIKDSPKDSPEELALRMSMLYVYDEQRSFELMQENGLSCFTTLVEDDGVPIQFTKEVPVEELKTVWVQEPKDKDHGFVPMPSNATSSGPPPGHPDAPRAALERLTHEQWSDRWMDHFRMHGTMRIVNDIIVTSFDDYLLAHGFKQEEEGGPIVRLTEEDEQVIVDSGIRERVRQHRLGRSPGFIPLPPSQQQQPSASPLDNLGAMRNRWENYNSQPVKRRIRRIIPATFGEYLALYGYKQEEQSLVSMSAEELELVELTLSGLEEEEEDTVPSLEEEWNTLVADRPRVTDNPQLVDMRAAPDATMSAFITRTPENGIPYTEIVRDGSNQ